MEKLLSTAAIAEVSAVIRMHSRKRDPRSKAEPSRPQVTGRLR